MSYDLAIWGGTWDDPMSIWSSFRYDESVRFSALPIEKIRNAFVNEFGADLQVEENEESLSILGQGWEAFCTKSSKYLHIACGWMAIKDESLIEQIVRAGLNANCIVFDPQNSTWWEPNSDSVSDDYDVWGSMVGD